MKGLVRFVSLLEDGTPEDVSFPPGVLPLPKPDENQTDFISVGDVYQMPFSRFPSQIRSRPPPAVCRRRWRQTAKPVPPPIGRSC